MIRELAIAITLPFVALAAQWLSWPWIVPYVWFFFFPTVFLSARLTGFKGGMISTALSILIVWLFFMHQTTEGSTGGAAHSWSVALFALMGYLISDSQESVRRLQQVTEGRFQATFEQAAIGMALVRPDGGFLRVNRKLCQILGYDADELLTKKCTDITCYEDLETSLHERQRLTEGDAQSVSVEERCIRKNGRQIRTNNTITLVKTQDGAPDYYICAIEDIESRRRTELKLQENSNALREAQHIASVGHWIRNLKTGAAYWSEELFHLFGREPSLGPPKIEELAQFFTPESWEKLSPALETLKFTGAPVECDAEVACPDTGHQWVIVRGEAKRDSDGAIIELCGTVQDITVRKEMEQALRASEARLKIGVDVAGLALGVINYDTGVCHLSPVAARLAARRSAEFLRGVLDSLPTEIAVLDGEGRIIAVNEAWVRFGLANHAPPQSVSPGINYLEVCRIAAEGADVDARKALEGLEALLAGSMSSFTLEYPCGTLERREWFVMHAARSVHATTTVVVSHTNITDRRRAEAALSESEGRLQLFIEHAPAALAMFDREMRYIAVSQRWKDDYGFGTQDIIGTSHYDLFPDIPERWRSIHLRGLTGEILRSDEDRFDRDDGSVIWLRWEVRPWRTSDGSIGGIIIFAEDITKVRVATEAVLQVNAVLEKRVSERTAQLLEARAWAEAANKAKSSFLANMSHEIRTPMNAILGFVHLLLSDAASPQQADRLAHIHRAGQHLLAVINDILDLSKIEAGHMKLERRDFDLGQLLADVGSLISEGARKKGLRVVIDTDSMPARVFGDDTRLRQALLNFANNAVKFTEKGAVTLRVLLLEQDEQQIVARFEVQDTGIGVDPQILPRLFRPFEQADDSTTRHYGGTGLGLAITRRLAENMGGEAGAVSAPGTGSTFWFTARLSRSESRGKVEASRLRADRASMPRLRPGARILLAEDNTINRQVAVELLSGFGLCVEAAHNGREVLEMTEAHDYDLVLMDIQMPEIDGIAATRALRRLPAWSAKPILALSANVFEETRKACAEAGMNDFISKPIDPDALYQTLGKWLPLVENAPHVARSARNLVIAPLRSIPGLDAEQGLQRLNDNFSSYNRLLKRFVADHAADVARMQEHIGGGDMTAAAHIAHTLKGVAGNLGAFKIECGAASIEAAIKARASVAEIEASTLVLHDELQSLVLAIDSNIAREALPPAPMSLPNGAFLQKALDELESALVDNDVRANEIFEASASLLTPALGLYGEKIERQINDYQYEDALHILRTFRKDKSI